MAEHQIRDLEVRGSNLGPGSNKIVIFQGRNYKFFFHLSVDGLGGLGITCSPRDPRFAGLNPVEINGFYQDLKVLSISSPGGYLSWGSRV